MITIYHNARCKISRSVLEILKQKMPENKIKIKEYLKEPFTIEEIKDLLVRLHLQPQDILRKNEPYYKENLKNKNFSYDEWLRIIIENPKIIERPIVVKDNKAVICRPIEKLNELRI